VSEVVSWLAERGHHATAANAGGLKRRHDVELHVASFSAAGEVAAAPCELGFERWERWIGAAGESFGHHADQITVARTRDHSFVLRIRCGWDMTTLPRPLLRAYSLVRSVRLLLERSVDVTCTHRVSGHSSQLQHR
jgi:hypothetical protein